MNDAEFDLLLEETRRSFCSCAQATLRSPSAERQKSNAIAAALEAYQAPVAAARIPAQGRIRAVLEELFAPRAIAWGAGAAVAACAAWLTLHVPAQDSSPQQLAKAVPGFESEISLLPEPTQYALYVSDIAEEYSGVSDIFSDSDTSLGVDYQDLVFSNSDAEEFDEQETSLS